MNWPCFGRCNECSIEPKNPNGHRIFDIYVSIPISFRTVVSKAELRFLRLKV